LCEVELPKARRIRKDVDLDDLSSPHRETHDGQRPSIWEPTDDSRHSVHKRQSGRLSKARERQSSFCHRTRTSHDPQSAWIGAKHHVWVKHRKQRLKVTCPCGCKESVLTLTGDRICAMTRFDNSVLPWFGLPRTVPSR
jgi:hypothetical protein